MLKGREKKGMYYGASEEGEGREERRGKRGREGLEEEKKKRVGGGRTDWDKAYIRGRGKKEQCKQ